MWFGEEWYGMVWYGMVWHDMVWYGMVWHGMVWYGMAWQADKSRGRVQKSHPTNNSSLLGIYLYEYTIAHSGQMIHPHIFHDLDFSGKI